MTDSNMPERIKAISDGKWWYDHGQRAGTTYIRSDLAHPAPVADAELEALIKAAEIKSGMLKMGERIAFGSDAAIIDQLVTALRARTAQPVGVQWQPIETAPNEETILVARDDGSVELIDAEDNDYTWMPHDGLRLDYCSRATHWMPLPAAPALLPDGGA